MCCEFNDSTFMLFVQVEDTDASKAHAEVCEKLAAAERKMDVISRGRDAAKAERSQLEGRVAELEVRLSNADSVRPLFSHPWP